MSGGYFRVGSQFWTDPMVTRWDKDTKLIALYLLTSPHRITEGLFRQPSAYIVADTELPASKVEKALKRMEADGFIERDGDMVLIVRALKWQAPKAEANAKHAARKLIGFQTPLLVRLMELANAQCGHLAVQLAIAKPELSCHLSPELSTELSRVRDGR